MYKIPYYLYMIRIILTLNVCLVLMLSINIAKADFLNDLIESAVDAAVDKVLEVQCKEPEAGVCKCSPYTQGTGNEDIVGIWDNCKGKFIGTDGVVGEGDWKAGNMHGDGVMRAGNNYYKGGFVNGEFHGKGEITTDGGETVITANYKGGEMFGSCTSIHTKRGKENGDCSSGEFKLIKKDSDKYVDNLKNFYTFNEYNKRCNASGLLSDRKYTRFKKNIKTIILSLQKMYNVPDKDVKSLKAEAGKRGKAVASKPIQLLEVTTGFGKPIDEYSLEEFGAVSKFCNDSFSQQMILVRQYLKIHGDKKNNSDDEELDF